MGLLNFLINESNAKKTHSQCDLLPCFCSALIILFFFILRISCGICSLYLIRWSGMKLFFLPTLAKIEVNCLSSRVIFLKIIEVNFLF